MDTIYVMVARPFQMAYDCWIKNVGGPSSSFLEGSLSILGIPSDSSVTHGGLPQFPGVSDSEPWLALPGRPTMESGGWGFQHQLWSGEGRWSSAHGQLSIMPPRRPPTKTGHGSSGDLPWLAIPHALLRQCAGSAFWPRRESTQHRPTGTLPDLTPWSPLWLVLLCAFAAPIKL